MSFLQKIFIAFFLMGLVAGGVAQSAGPVEEEEWIPSGMLSGSDASAWLVPENIGAPARVYVIRFTSGF